MFGRDGSRCVVCGALGADAHHIMERRLFEDGGYHVDNGVTLCEKHHREAEATIFQPADLRAIAGITNVYLPEHLYSDYEYTKWGDIIHANGQRTPGELFNDESVQRAISGFLYLYTPYIKYPRTYHLPYSPGASSASDDKVLDDLSPFYGKIVIATVKMDGENTSMYSDGYIHARSLFDDTRRRDRDWVKNFWSQRFFELPDGWRVCGENLFATHSIKYSELKSFFQGFSIWNEKNVCLDWADTLEWFALLGIEPVFEFWAGPFDPEKIHNAYEAYAQGRESEGYVIRLAESFTYTRFRKSVVKYVRENHVQTAKHWFAGQRLEKNELVS